MRGLKVLIGSAMIACCLSNTGWCEDINSRKMNPIISDLIIRSVAGTLRIPESKFTVADISYAKSGGSNYAGNAYVTMAGTNTFRVSFSMISDNKTVALQLDNPTAVIQAATLNETDKEYHLPSDNNRLPENAGPITAQYSGLKWGMSKAEARKLAVSQGKKNVSSSAANGPEGNILKFDDVFLDERVVVTLYFTPKSGKLFKISTKGLDAFHYNALISSLNNKYGKYKAAMPDGGYYWDSGKEGDRIEISREGLLIYSNVEGLILAEKEKEIR